MPGDPTGLLTLAPAGLLGLGTTLSQEVKVGAVKVAKVDHGREESASRIRIVSPEAPKQVSIAVAETTSKRPSLASLPGNVKPITVGLPSLGHELGELLLSQAKSARKPTPWHGASHERLGGPGPWPVRRCYRLRQ
jgi:hypothetical protein